MVRETGLSLCVKNRYVFIRFDEAEKVELEPGMGVNEYAAVVDRLEDKGYRTSPNLLEVLSEVAWKNARDFPGEIESLSGSRRTYRGTVAAAMKYLELLSTPFSLSRGRRTNVVYDDNDIYRLNLVEKSGERFLQAEHLLDQEAGENSFGDKPLSEDLEESIQQVYTEML